MGDDIIFKTLALITMNVGQNPIDIKHSANEDFSKCLLTVGNEGLAELLKVSVSTKTFSLQSLDGPIFRKSLHNRSKGLLTTSDPCCVCGPV